jgi:hypothetical protein
MLESAVLWDLAPYIIVQIIDDSKERSASS